ncbi:MAG: hypothetical protein RRB22_12680 [Gammaproteobacteria bacterium]|nr:hypothetical protein [Gammaproteobacteria bacterium]
MKIYRFTSPQHPWATALPDLLVRTLALFFLMMPATRIITFVPTCNPLWIKDRFFIALSRLTLIRFQYLQAGRRQLARRWGVAGGTYP